MGCGLNRCFFLDVFAEHLEWRNLERWKLKLKDILKTYMFASLWVLLLTPELLFKETEIAQLESQGIFKSQGLVCFYAKAEMTSAALPQIFLWIQNHVHVQQKHALVKSSQTKKCWLLFPINIFQYLECFPFWVLCWESRFSATPKKEGGPQPSSQPAVSSSRPIRSPLCVFLWAGTTVRALEHKHLRLALALGVAKQGTLLDTVSSIKTQTLTV